jgi:trans-aconitate 2-methyltransferase
MSSWNPDQYERFRAERAQPFFDLLALVRKKPGMRVVDLGCGTGALTRKLHDTLGAASTLGIDSSETMLARSFAHVTAGLRFERARIEDVEGTFDLVFSNAALHWVEDHPRLLARLYAMLAPGGQLAVQVPANFDHVSHTVAADVAREPPFCAMLGGYARSSPVLAPEEYAAALHRVGFVDQCVRLQVYAHLLPTREDVIEWVKGTLLTDYERRLSAGAFAQFLARYRERLLPRLEDTRPHFYPFKRILFRAARA